MLADQGGDGVAVHTEEELQDAPPPKRHRGDREKAPQRVALVVRIQACGQALLGMLMVHLHEHDIITVRASHTASPPFTPHSMLPRSVAHPYLSCCGFHASTMSACPVATNVGEHKGLQSRCLALADARG